MGAGHLSGTLLDGANLSVAKLAGACLSRADLTNAVLVGAGLTEANMRDAILKNANLERANLTDIRHLLLRQISTVKSIENASLSEDLVTILEDNHPHLLGK